MTCITLPDHGAERPLGGSAGTAQGLGRPMRRLQWPGSAKRGEKRNERSGHSYEAAVTPADRDGEVRKELRELSGWIRVAGCRLDDEPEDGQQHRESRRSHQHLLRSWQVAGR